MSENKRSPKERAAQFVGALRRACEDRGKRAALRRGLSPATVMDAWPVIASLGGDIGQPGESVYVDIAALFASHTEESKARNFGETCRRIAQGDGKEIPDSFERRFRRLLACDDVANVTGQLRSWVRLAASRNVGVNYESLMNDLLWWDRSADRTRVEWARAFWQSGDLPTETPTANLNPATA
jgi:CRISPR system Cascade subunit CasB